MQKEAKRLMNIVEAQVKELVEHECNSYIFYVAAFINENKDCLTESEQLVLRRTTRIYRMLKRGQAVNRIDIDRLKMALIIIKRRFMIKSFV